MEKEQILSTLKEKLETNSLSDRTLTAYIEVNMPEEGSDFDFDKHTEFLKSLNGNYSHDVAETVTKQMDDFKKNYKSPTKKEEPSAEEKKEVEGLKAQIQALCERIDKKESEESRRGLYDKVKAELKKQGCNDAYVLKNALAKVELDTERKQSEIVKDALKIYDSEFAECRGSGAMPRKGGGGNARETTEADSYFAKKKAKREKKA